MPFEVGEAINGMIDSFLNAPFVSTVSKNPLYTALAITLVILLILLFVFRDADGAETTLVMSLRSSFWIFLLLIGALLVHNRVLMNEAANVNQKQNHDSMFAPVPSRLHSEYVPVVKAVPQPQYQQPQPPPQYQQPLPPSIPQYSYP